MEYRDYYATLGVPKNASQADIKKAFRKLARQHHPDVNKGDAAAERRFKEVSEANEVLSDPQKRKAYDQLGANWAAYERAGGAGGASPFADFRFGGASGASAPGGIRFEFHGDAEDLSGFSDFFRTFFAGSMGASGQGGRNAAAAGSSRAGQSGGGRTRTAETFDFDPLFGGLGGDSGTGYASSGFGAGSPRGARRQVHREPADAIAETTVTLEEVLTGTKRHIEVGDKRLEVSIPAGVRDGQRIRLSGRAEGGGHIYITVHVAPHPVFARDGAHLAMDLPLTLGEALLGGEVAVVTLGGRRLLLTIPPATQNGRVIRLSGQGLPRGADGGRGDLRVRASVVLPGTLDEQGQRLARALVDHIDQPDPRAGQARARQRKDRSA